jgi:hypothetical protein
MVKDEKSTYRAAMLFPDYGLNASPLKKAIRSVAEISKK